MVVLILPRDADYGREDVLEKVEKVGTFVLLLALLLDHTRVVTLG
jgi:hypothetical protein